MSILIGSAARKRIGGSAFLEIQYCPYPADTPIKKLVAVDSVAHFQADSLYVHMDDINTFWALYGDVFNGGVYSNLRTGPVDHHPSLNTT